MVEINLNEPYRVTQLKFYEYGYSLWFKLS